MQPIQAPLAGSLLLWEDLIKDAFELGIPERPGVGTGGCFKRVGDAFALQQRVEFPVGGQQGILFAADHADGRQAAGSALAASCHRSAWGGSSPWSMPGPNTARAAAGGKGQSGLLTTCSGRTAAESAVHVV